MFLPVHTVRYFWRSVPIIVSRHYGFYGIMQQTQDFANCELQAVKIYENTLIIQKKNSYLIKMWQTIFIPNENVAKYFGTPPMIHSAPVPGIENNRSLNMYRLLRRYRFCK